MPYSVRMCEYAMQLYLRNLLHETADSIALVGLDVVI